MKIINLIQDIATPHNNVLINQFKNSKEIKIKLWYAIKEDELYYKSDKNISHLHFPAEIYGQSINFEFIKYCLTHKNEKFVIVGWMNINTRLIYLLFFLLRRPFNHWTDLPNNKNSENRFTNIFFRWFAYKILKFSNSRIFCVGVKSMEYFRQLGFSEKRLVNLPIFVQLDENIELYHAKRGNIFAKYHFEPKDFVLSAGSRIIYEKGFDLLIRAMYLIDKKILKHIRVVIVGNGPEVFILEQLIIDLKLTNIVFLEKWLTIEDFKALIANSNVFIHPARFDAFGGTIYGMSLGIPIIGTYQAGAALERITQGRNGFLYDAENIHDLANFITLLYSNPILCKNMGKEARKTALQWPPQRGIEILTLNAI